MKSWERVRTQQTAIAESSISPESVFVAREEMAKIEVSDIVETT